MKKNWTAYTVFMFALLKPFNKTSLITLLITVTLYIIPGIVGNGVVPGVSADEGIDPGVSADEGIDPGVSAEEMSNGQMGGIIRSASHPCAKVTKLQSAAESLWIVQCNSGSFIVRRNTNGQFSVSTSN